MSWQAYVDDHLLCEIDGQHLTAAAIIGHDGSVWAQSENFPQVYRVLCLFDSSVAFFSKLLFRRVIESDQIWCELLREEEEVVVCRFQVIPSGGYDGGGYDKCGGLEVEVVERKLLQLEDEDDEGDNNDYAVGEDDNEEYEAILAYDDNDYSKIKPEEINGIMNDFSEPGHLAPTGLYVGNTKYMVIQGEPGAVIRGKKDSSKIAPADPYESNIGGISQKLKIPPNLICQNNAKSSIEYTLDRPPLTISCLLTNGLLERLLEHYKKDRIKLLRCIKDIGISFGCSSHRLNEVLSLNFEKHGGASSMKSKDCIFLNDKLALYALVEEFGKVPLGLLPGELIQKMIGCQPNNIDLWLGKNHFIERRLIFKVIVVMMAQINLHIYCFIADLVQKGNSVEVSVSRQAKKTKHREMDFHQQIFELINDGTKLSYYSHVKEILEGYKFGKNILCSCCNAMLSASKFEAHAGHEKRRKPYHSIYTSYGKSLHQIAMFLLLDDLSNKDMSMTNKAGGKSTFTLRCQNAHNAGGQSSNTCSPFGFQLGRIFQAPCNLGSCIICRGGDATLNFGNICDNTMLFCGQCGRMFHVGCLRLHGICDIKARPSQPETWLCGDKCIKIRADLLSFVQDGPMSITESLLTSMHSSVGSTVHTHTQIDVHWQLVSGRFQGDKSKLLLQQAMKNFQEAFGAVYKGYRDVLSTMVNGEKGVAEFFGGMFCVVVAVKSKIVSVALLRVFGNHVAEIPLAATTNERRGQGFFKILFFKIEEMLSFLKVENLIIPADDHSLFISEGLTFAISPTPNLYYTLPSQVLELFNLSSNGQATNHIVIVELDTIEKEFDDINDNHVGINLNSLVSVAAAPASYAKSSSLFRNLSLISGHTMRVWAEYDAKKMEFNVTLAPLNTLKPVLPLLSYTINLSSILLSKMYVGFSSSTGVATGSHYILRWSFCLNGREAELLTFNLLAARNETAWRSETDGCIEIETLSSLGWHTFSLFRRVIMGS
ncbi:hypothetical protein IEQ34_020272 [Dendrobium chrysotoxum]|uniref:Zinc finger PHD-type domain-containing protein n=1 Tax=Dendrobium chrysotoxum TaxID=161865 RepID=A0AAV7FKG5_DENCH|nr:hypothetical protein IEQ34_020272 [Dendrobium chrysotoxum]